MLNRILVPTDFGAPSSAALTYARMLSDASGSIHLMHVLENTFLRPVVGDLDNLEAAARKRIQQQAMSVGSRRLPVVPIVARSDEPVDEILTHARTAGIDLIVMGTHGRSGLSHMLMGSVAEKVVRAAPCPVLTVHHAPGESVTGFRRILVPTDFGAASDAALDRARLMAARFGASLHLLHVLEDAGAEAIHSDLFVTRSPDAHRARLEDARERLKHRVSDRDRVRLRETTEVLSGASAQMIVDYALDNEFDLIVMGTHGRTGIAHLLVGSVAERVVRTAACPVMTTRLFPNDAEAAVPDESTARTTA